MLALVGSGEYLPPIEPLDRTLMGLLPESARVVCLPTAAGLEGDERIRYWMDLGVRHFTRLGAAVEALPLVERSGALDQGLAERIRQANFVYLSGGKPDYLHHTLDNSPAWEAILEVHQRGGMVAGCSAGAMIMGERLPGFPGWGAAFGLLPGTAILPHFDEIPPVFIRTARFLAARRLTVLGIEGNTALLVTPGGWQAAGLGGVTVWDSQARRRYPAGEAVPEVIVQ